MKTEKANVMIKTSNLHPHPDNPRKNVGDVTELAESIKKNGLMQNLTVIPLGYDKPAEEQDNAEEVSEVSDFIVLIGHRRLAAAKEAGLEELPCKIVSNISLSEQIGIMMEENMQRNDLTIYEQAQGMQMMLDLGETIETIQDKTGFSKSTIYHRLNIAKLNQKELKKKEDDENFQLSLKDLTELEKVKNVKDRNRILKEASDSSNLRYKINQQMQEDKKNENEKKILKELKDRNLQPAPEGTYQYDRKWEVVKSFYLSDDIKEVKLKKCKEQLYYLRNYSYLYILKKSAVEEQKGNESTGLSDAEKKRRKSRRILKNINDSLNDKMRDCIKQILFKNLDWPDKDISDKAWEVLTLFNIHVGERSLYQQAYKLTYDEKKEYWRMNEEDINNVKEILKELPIGYQMLMLTEENVTSDLYGYNAELRKEDAKKYIKLFVLLHKFGFSISDEERQLLEGTHEAFRDNWEESND